MLIGWNNVVFGWGWLLCGITMGLIMGMWVENERWLGGYSSLTRRYLRLAHVAFIALPIINILYGKELMAVDLPVQIKAIGSVLMIFGAIGIPLSCLFAAFFRPIKYFLPLPAIAVFLSTAILVVGLIF